MKSYILIILSFFIYTVLFAQDKLPPLDKSPLDISYCPPGYTINRASGNSAEPLVARVIYSRPAVNNRKIFGGLIEYGNVWRFGANESTEIEFFKEVLIGGKKIKKGRYTLYAIPTEKKWTIIFSKETDTWGAFNYDVKKDVMRIDVPVENIVDSVDSFTIYFDKISKYHNNYAMIALWENAKISLSFSVVK
jgi:hypothetical protein